MYRLSTVPEHCPKANTSLWPSSQTSVFICMLVSGQALKDLFLSTCVLRHLLVGKPTQIYCWNWVTCGLVAWPSHHPSSWQHSPIWVVTLPSACRSVLQPWCRKVTDSGRQRCSVGHGSYRLWLLPGLSRLPLPGEETKKQGSQGAIQP